MTLGILIALAGAAFVLDKGSDYYVNSAWDKERKPAFSKTYKEYKQILKSKGIEDVPTKDLIEDLWQSGAVNEKTYKKALSYYKKLEDAETSDGTFWDGLGDWWNTSVANKETYQQGVELYKIIAENAPNLNWTKGKTYDEIVSAVNGAFKSGLPKIDDAPTPQYLDTMFANTQIAVTDPKEWTSAELAELHNINFDPNHYYDLIKQGTEANIAAGEFTNRQLETLANSQDTKNVTSYLDSIRNAKAEALANGATMGARAAAEVLANSEAINAQANTQAQLANTKAQNMDALLQADAKANLSARQYFDQLANALGSDAVANYTADVDRYGQEVLTNADLYKADQELRAQHIISNAAMYREYLDSQGAINLYKNKNELEANEYSWLFQKALEANGGDVYNAQHVVNDYIFNNINRNKGNDRTTYINDLIS